MRTKTGIITSTKMENTAVITVDSYKSHPKYKKKIRKSKNFFVDDPGNKLKEGDKITVVETRPLSKLKRWKILEEVKKN